MVRNNSAFVAICYTAHSIVWHIQVIVINVVCTNVTNFSRVDSLSHCHLSDSLVTQSVSVTLTHCSVVSLSVSKYHGM